MLREIQNRLAQLPFAAFRIFLADGRMLDVPHPEFLWIESGWLYYIHPSDPVGERINTVLIVSIAPLLAPQKVRRH